MCYRTKSVSHCGCQTNSNIYDWQKQQPLSEPLQELFEWFKLWLTQYSCPASLSSLMSCSCLSSLLCTPDIATSILVAALCLQIQFNQPSQVETSSSEHRCKIALMHCCGALLNERPAFRLVSVPRIASLRQDGKALGSSCSGHGPQGTRTPVPL